MTHRFSVRVHYEDTDMGGLVYHANYLKFIERARSEWVREMGIDQVEMNRQDGLVFAVRHMEIDFLSPAHFGDTLDIETRLISLSGARMVMDQRILRGSRHLFQAAVTLVCMKKTGQVARLPARFRLLDVQ